MRRRSFLKSVCSLAAALSFLSVGTVSAANDDRYIVLDSPIPNAEGTLIKVFSYDCIFCYKYDAKVDPRIVPLLEKEAGLKFRSMHLETKGKYGRQANIFLAMCQLRDEKAGVAIESDASLFRKAKDAMYVAYHKKRERWNQGESAFIKTLTDATGLTSKDFELAKKDAEVLALVDSWKVAYTVGKVQGIPAYVVNGKYLLMTRKIYSAQGMVALIKELAAKK